MDLITQPGLEKLRSQVAANGDGEVMVRGAMEPEYGELIAIEIELRIGSAGYAMLAACAALSTAGCEGGAPLNPKSPGVATIPRPK